MNLNPIALIVLLCGVLTLSIAMYAWNRRNIRGGRSFTAFTASMAIYILGYFMELVSPSLDQMLFWSKIEYIGILTFPTIFLVFVLEYSGYTRWLTRRNLALAFLFPGVFLLAKFADDSLHIIYAAAAIDAHGAIPLLSFTRGPLYLVIVAYNLLAVTLGNGLLLRKRRHASTLYRKQTAIILSVAVVLYFLYGVYISGIRLFPGLEHLDLNPFVYTLWGAAIWLAIFRYHLFDLAPVARDALIEMLGDGVLVLDAQSRLVDANPAALRIFGWRQAPVGEAADKITGGILSTALLAKIEHSKKIETRLDVDDSTVYYEVTLSTLNEKQGRQIGFLAVIHDISERKAVEQALQEMSLVDDLTGLANRRGFKILGAQLFGMVNRMKLNAVMFYIDMDGLKTINDSLGHAVGDQALKDTAAILKNSFRVSDIIARIGGDEFVILAVESDENSAEILKGRLIERVAACNAQPGRIYRLSISIGQARLRAGYARSLDALLEEADAAMYEDKQAKKARLAS